MPVAKTTIIAKTQNASAGPLDLEVAANEICIDDSASEMVARKNPSVVVILFTYGLVDQ